MTNRVGSTVKSDYVFVEGKVEVPETFTAKVAGTAASITDTTSYPVTDQDGLTSVITITGDSDNTGAQTVTFSGATTTAAGVAAQMNTQLTGCSVAVVGGQVVITTDKTGSTVAIAAAAGTGGLTWDTPVAGTGSPDGVVVTPGDLLARTTSGTAPYTAGDIVLYDSGNDPAGANTIRGIADFDLTVSASGSKAIKMSIAGKVVKDKITKADGTAVTKAELDALVENTNISYAPVADVNDYQN